MDNDMFLDCIKGLQKYNISFYTDDRFDFEEFREQCISKINYLEKYDQPINDIRYKLCDLLSVIQTITGIRYLAEFIS